MTGTGKQKNIDKQAALEALKDEVDMIRNFFSQGKKEDNAKIVKIISTYIKAGPLASDFYKKEIQVSQAEITISFVDDTIVKRFASSLLADVNGYPDNSDCTDAVRSLPRLLPNFYHQNLCNMFQSIQINDNTLRIENSKILAYAKDAVIFMAILNYAHAQKQIRMKIGKQLLSLYNPSLIKDEKQESKGQSPSGCVMT